MPLEIQEIREILKESPTGNKNVIPKAKNQEDRLRFHTETAMERRDVSSALMGFLDFVDGLLPKEKFEMFLAFLKFPISTVTLTEEIYTALEKIFDGRNPVYRYEFLNPEDREDWEMYRVQKLREPNVWKEEGFETMKTAINSVVIVDLPEVQEGSLPEPYFYFLGIENFIDFKLDDKGEEFEWVIFRLKGNRLAVYCDGYYRVFKLKEGSRQEIQGEPEVENPHDLGYCPARFFWTTPISLRNRSIKKSPISNQLGKLDLLLFFDVSNEHLNTYGRYPIYSGFGNDCKYEDGVGNYCDGGFLKSRDEVYLKRDGKIEGCPICEQKRIDGAGSFIEIDPPNAANGNADLRNPIQITSIDRNSLDYNNEDIMRRRLEVYAAVTGYKGLPINDQAVNEKQVLAIFESLEASLKNPQMNMERIMQWEAETVCRLRYGSDRFITASISLGTEHFIMNTADIMNLYDLGKKSNFSVGTLDMLEELYYETEFRNNPEQLQRQRVLLNLDPFRHLALSQVETMYNSGAIKFEDYMMKINFSSLIMRFERENMNVLEFGQGLEFNKKIESIRNSLKVYVNEMKPIEKVIEKPNPDE